MKCACTALSHKRVTGLPDNLRPRLFSGLAATELGEILSAATHRHFPEHSVVIHQHDPAERFFLLTSGQGRHFVLTSSGRKVILYWLTAGQFFGGVTMLSAPSAYLASAEVLPNSCALVWDRKTIREFVSRFPRLLDNALSVAVTEHIASSVSARVSLSSDDAAGRVAHLLVSLACGIGKVGRDGIELQVGNEELAAGANVTQFTVSRLLKKWQLEGILTKERGKVLLRRPELLMISE